MKKCKRNIPVIEKVVLPTLLVFIFHMAQAAPASQDIVRRGEYLARAGDCGACHTTDHTKPFSGGMPFDVSVGKVYSTNITPDTATGIGQYGLDDFVKVMRQGIAKDGHRLYPAMPYACYTRVSNDDLSALYAFFMQSVKPQAVPNYPPELNWLLGKRYYMAIWDAFYFKKGEYIDGPEKNAAWNRGAYLVQGLGHCGDCHTPRGAFGHVKDASEKSGNWFLAGGMIDNWHASALNNEYKTGLRAWSKNDIVEFLKTGRTTRVAALGIMAQVVEKSTQYLTDTDLFAIAEYLKSLPPFYAKGQNTLNTSAQTPKDSMATIALRSGKELGRGAPLYVDNCNSCHGSDGRGAMRTFPDLVKNETVNAKDPMSLIHLVLEGSAMPSTQTAPSAIAMPGFGWRLSDSEIVDVLDFIRNSWGNHAESVGLRQVYRIRKALETNN